MKQTVDNSMFRQAFTDMNRKENFSYPALDALFDYYEEMEDADGTEMELDVIAICCDWSEMEREEIIEEYGYLLDHEEDLDDDEYFTALIEYISAEKTLVLPVEDHSGKKTWLVASF